ncbi:MAG: polysaccharide biosynthesis protein, partial [Sphingomonadales bacterium]|nr:polysaccharide biosynthesis protein [Sphingomonadales bacterium]
GTISPRNVSSMMGLALEGIDKSGSALAHVRIGLTHLWRHRRLPDLNTPRTFNELVQCRKLYDRDPRLSILADKVRVKSIVEDRIGREWVIPTLWHGSALPRRPDWPTPFVVKSRHGCNQTRFIHQHDSARWEAVTGHSRHWMRGPYGTWLDEWAYLDIPRGLLVEPFMGPGPGLPVDYKFFVFGGRVEFIQVHLGRGIKADWSKSRRGHRWIVFDRAWQRRSSLTSDPAPAKPASLSLMIAAAEELARDIDFVRVDLYEIEGRPLFGEMTFYPGSGLDAFDPVTLDREMGAHWLRARQNTGAESQPQINAPWQPTTQSA